MGNINQRLNGLNPLAYAGVNAVQPPDFLTKNRPPNSTDSKNFQLGQIWLDFGTNTPPTANDIYMLVSLDGNVATWVAFGSGDLETLTGNVGGAVGPDGANNIDIIGDGTTIITVGNPGANTLTISTVGTGVINTLTGNSGGAVSPTAGNINVVGSGVITVEGNPGTSTLTVTPSGAIASSFPTDSGTATPSLGVLNIRAGTATVATNCGSTVEFEATGNTVKLDVSDSSGNTIIGRNSGNLTFSSTNTTVFGAGSAQSLTSSSNNLIAGQGSALLLAGGSGSNTILGQGSAATLVSGSKNFIAGMGSGSNLTGSESNNLLINHAGITGASNWIIIANGTPNRFISTDMIDNQFIGIHAGNTTLTGVNNTVLGANSLNLVTTSSGNTIVGNQVMTTATSGAMSNTIVGAGAYHVGTDSNNTIIGNDALFTATTAADNTVIGASAGWDSGSGLGLTTGDMNILIGYTAGSAYRGNESNNVIIDNGTGIAVAGESNKTKISGIRGATTTNADAIAVLIDSAGQLGTVSSSARYKDNIVDMGSYSDDIMKLRPVIFNYKQHCAESKSVGLIAEEVKDVMPQLVVHDKEGLPETIKYHDLVPMLLNELIKTRKSLDNAELRLDELTRRIQILEFH